MPIPTLFYMGFQPSRSLKYIIPKIDDQGLRNTLADLVDRGGDLSPAMQAVAGALGRGIEQTFRNQSASDGLPWAALSPVTIARREKSGHTPISILQQTGQLVAISTGFGSNHAVAGTNVVYAATHQFGAKKGDFGTNKRGGPTLSVKTENQ